MKQAKMRFRFLLMLAIWVGCQPIVFAQGETSSVKPEVGASIGTSVGSSAGPSRWSRFYQNVSYSFFNFSTAPMDQANVRAARLDAYNFLSADYKIAANHKISARPVFTFATAGTNFRNEYQAGDFRLGDAYINYQYSRWRSEARNVDFKMVWRLYAPTSEMSAKQALITRLRPEFNIRQYLGGSAFSLIAKIEPDYYFQSRTASPNEKNEPQPNRNFGYESIYSLHYDFSRSFSVEAGVGHDQMWHHASPINGKDEVYRSEKGKIDLSMQASIGPAFLILGVSQKRDIATPRNSARFLAETESAYYLLNAWRL